MEEKNLKEMNLTEKVDKICDLLENDPKKVKKIKIPRKAKVSKRKIKKGWLGVLKIHENRNITAEKIKIEGGAFNTSDGTYHASDGSEIFFFEGKFPVLIQPTWKKNPLKIDMNNEKNETYGQHHIMTLMLNNQIDIKKKSLAGNPLVWIVVAGIAFFIIKSIIEKGGI